MKKIIKWFKRVFYGYNGIQEIFWYNPKHGIPSLIRWFKPIYRDRNWDHTYIKDLIITKLRFQANYIEKHKRFEGYEKTVSDMRESANLLEKTKDEMSYIEKDIYNLEKEYGFLGFYFVKCEDRPGCSEMLEDFDPLTTDEQKEEYKNKLHDLYAFGELQRKEDLRKAFNIMIEHLEEWWD